MERLFAVTAFAILLVAQSDVCCGQWVPTSDFTVSSATAFAGDDQALYGVTGGRLYSIDPSSYSWSLIPSSPTDINTVAKVGYNLFVATINYEFYESDNSGVTWTRCKIGTTNLASNWVISSGGMVFAGTDGEGVYLSSDSGSTWTQSNTGLTALNINCLFATGTTVLAGTPFGVFISFNSGVTWSGTAALSDHFISRVATDGTILYEGNDEGINGGLFYSLDNGGSWVRDDAGLPNKNIHALATTSHGVYAGTDSGLYFSSDRGANWSAIKSGMEGSWIFAINHLGELGDYIFVGCSAGAFVTTDEGYSWQTSNEGQSAGVSSVGDLIANGKVLLAGAGYGDDDPSSGVFQSSDGGQTWASTIAGLPSNTAITSIAAEDSFLFAGSDSGIYISTNQGESWYPSDSGINTFYAFPGMATIGPNVLAVQGNSLHDYSVYRSTNNGNSWSVTESGTFIDFITSIGDKVYVGREGDPIGTLFMSDDSGAHWKSISNGLTNGTFTGCATLGSKLFVAANYFDVSILCTSDDGASWTTLDTGLSLYNITAFLSYDSALIVGNGEGVFFSNDEGVHWSKANTGLYDSSIQTLAIHGSTLFAGTLRGGIYQRSLSEMLGLLDVARPVNTQSAIQSYPNPFTQSTTINFSSQDEGYADVTVVNLLGSQVARIFSGELAPGEHSFLWDANGMAPGMYECIVRMNGQVQRTQIEHYR